MSPQGELFGLTLPPVVSVERTSTPVRPQYECDVKIMCGLKLCDLRIKLKLSRYLSLPVELRQISCAIRVPAS